jgi:cholinesterase
MSRSWISFVHDLDPNGHQIDDAPHWPDYHESKSNIVFRADETHVEDDDWRKEQLEFWASIWEELQV